MIGLRSFISIALAAGFLCTPVSIAWSDSHGNHFAEGEAKLPENVTRLRGDALKEFVSDSTVTGVSAANAAWRYSVFRAPDGTFRATSTNGEKTSEDAGSWWVEDDRFCTKGTNWFKGQARCIQLYSRAGEKVVSLVVTHEGEVWDGTKLDWTYEKGNTRGL